jgi:hypothetical protein
MIGQLFLWNSSEKETRASKFLSFTKKQFVFIGQDFASTHLIYQLSHSLIVGVKIGEWFGE